MCHNLWAINPSTRCNASLDGLFDARAVCEASLPICTLCVSTPLQRLSSSWLPIRLVAHLDHIKSSLSIAEELTLLARDVLCASGNCTPWLIAFVMTISAEYILCAVWLASCNSLSLDQINLPLCKYGFYLTLHFMQCFFYACLLQHVESKISFL